MDIRMIYGSGSAAANAVAQIDILRPGRIVAIDWTVALDMEADADQIKLQLGFSSAAQSANDSSGVITNIHAWCNFVTSGMTVSSVNRAITGISIPVRFGERIYLHCLAATSATFYSTTILHIV